MSIWTNETKNSTNWSNQDKSGSLDSGMRSMAGLAMTYFESSDNITWTNETKNSASWSLQTKN